MQKTFTQSFRAANHSHHQRALLYDKVTTTRTKTHSHSRATQDPWAAADWIYRHNTARQSLPSTFPARTRKSVVESRNSLFIIHATDAAEAVPVPSSVTRASSIIFMILRGLTLPSLLGSEV